MKIIPSEKLEFNTPLSVNELENVLKNNVELKQSVLFNFSKKKSDKIFEGYYRKGHFNIQKTINYGNSFLPQIKGTYYGTSHGTKVIVELKLHEFISVFLIIWLSFVFFALIGIVYATIKNEFNPLAVLIPLIMLAFGILLSQVGFNSEKENSIKALMKMLKVNKFS